MDMNVIYAKAQPYIDWFLKLLASVGGVSGVVAFIVSIIKTKGNAKHIENAVKNIETNSLSLFQKAFPNEIKVSLQAFAKNEIKSAVDYVNKDIIERLDKIEETQKLLAQCMLCLKSVPDDLKNEVREATKVEDKPNETLVVSIDKDFDKVVKEQEIIPEV